MNEVAPLQASDLLERLRASTNPLTQFPRMGRMIPAVEHDWLRELIVGKYRVIYELRGDVISIATVLHSAQEISERLHQLWPGLE